MQSLLTGNSLLFRNVQVRNLTSGSIPSIMNLSYSQGFEDSEIRVRKRNWDLADASISPYTFEVGM